jgi:uncharacterized repeat protein (TIGR01451 family)
MYATSGGALARLVSYAWFLPVCAACMSLGCGDESVPALDCDASIVTLPVEPLVAGKPGSYAILVDYNHGLSCSEDKLCVTDTLPRSITCDPSDFDESATAAWNCTCDADKGLVQCCYTMDLPTKSGVLPDIIVPVLVDLKTSGEVENCASIDKGNGTFKDTDPSNDEHCDKTSISDLFVDIGIETSHSGSLIYGQTGVLHVTVTNNGDADVRDFIVVDQLPNEIKFIDWAPVESWACSGGPAATCTFSPPAGLAPGAVAYLDLFVQLGGPEEATGKVLQNCATLLTDDQNEDNDKACNELTIEAPLPCTSWLSWSDRDDPTGTGDWEVASLAHSNPPCPMTKQNPTGAPTGIQCETVGGQTLAQAMMMDPTVQCGLPMGLVCVNQDEIKATGGGCDYDYQVRVCCP